MPRDRSSRASLHKWVLLGCLLGMAEVQAHGINNPLSAVVANLEKKVTQDEKNTQSAVGEYDRYRASHPIDGDGSGQ